MGAFHRRDTGELRYPLRLVWNDDERRPRSPVRIVAGLALTLLVADLGRRVRPTPLPADGPAIDAINSLIAGAPQAAAIVLGVFLAAVLIDRRRLADLGLTTGSVTLRRFAGGFALGVGIAALSVAGGVASGYYEIVRIQVTGGPLVWLLVLGTTSVSILLTVISEELIARGYLITNVIEGFEGISNIPRGVTASIAIVLASLFFYITHSYRGQVFGFYAAGVAVPLGVAFVLSADLSIPVGIHFGVNIAGSLLGWQPLPVSIIQLSSTSTVAESLVFPIEAVIVHLAGAAMTVVLLLLWFRSTTGRIRVDPSLSYTSFRW